MAYQRKSPEEVAEARKRSIEALSHIISKTRHRKNAGNLLVWVT